MFELRGTVKLCLVRTPCSFTTRTFCRCWSCSLSFTLTTTCWFWSRYSPECTTAVSGRRDASTVLKCCKGRGSVRAGGAGPSTVGGAGPSKVGGAGPSKVGGAGPSKVGGKSTDFSFLRMEGKVWWLLLLDWRILSTLELRGLPPPRRGITWGWPPSWTRGCCGPLTMTVRGRLKGLTGLKEE